MRRLCAAPGTQHHKLLTSNVAPLDSDVAFIQSAISQIDVRLKCLAHEIKQAGAMLCATELEEEQLSLRSYRNQNLAILSPLRRLPPEVLGEIFSWTLQRPADFSRCSFRPLDSPWVLTHISRHWRAVATSTASLWSLVALNYDPVANPSSSYPLSALKTQIARATKLDVHLYGCQTSDSRPQVEALQSLMEHTRRWEGFSITLTTALFPLVAGIRDRIPVLRRVWIEWSDAASQAAAESIDCFQTAPSLVDAGICGAHRWIPVHFPWHQLTRYDIGVSWKVHHKFLRLTPNLVEARIHIVFNDDPWPESVVNIDLVCLRRLYVSHMDITRFLTLPIVEEIVVEMHDDDDGPAIQSHLAPSLERFSGPLRRLCFMGCPDGNIIAQVLQKLPSIVELEVAVDDLSSSIQAHILMSLLMASTNAGDTTLAPQLRVLSFGCEDKVSIDYELYLQLMTSRWEAEHCALKTTALLVCSGPGPDATTLRGLETLRERGLDIILRDGECAEDMICDWTFETE
ncbi:hypothetical protein DFH06DRAFT_1095681 [Mycena polygramma]|nr:hypothetical protein DFH06DRAFT_1095681 [Mycena polygramma]